MGARLTAPMHGREFLAASRLPDKEAAALGERWSEGKGKR